MLFTLMELVDLVFMIVMLGLIFMNFFKGLIKPSSDDWMKRHSWFDLNSFKFSVLVIAPAIVLHELAHKFIAMAFGMSATFHAAYLWLFIGLALSMMNFKFLFFVPAFVAITSGSPLQMALAAGAGPFMNLLLWIGSFVVLKYKLVKRKYYPAVFLTKQINMFLFIFNMIPIGPFDGAKFFGGMFQYLSTIF